jgi:GDP/UDP-N,N'-diacetylbacillosamine 2-epimerase (hydrolysing)
MTLNKIRVAALTSSRADYSILFPLLKALKTRPFDLNIVAFGSHLSEKHGTTIKNIISDGFNIDIQVDTMPESDEPGAISIAMGKTMMQFAAIWTNYNFDLIIAIGDRYEMFAACASSVPFCIPIAHIHGGETTLGAIDDALRNAITQMASFHFTTTEQYKQRVISMRNSDRNVYNVGALSIDNLFTLPLLNLETFREQFNIDMSIPSILITFHPETVEFEKNEGYIQELISALKELKRYQLIITMPNADTMGNMVRKYLNDFIANATNAVGVESFGTVGYLSCMKHCKMLLGNTSSGFVEAAFFPRYVVNLGKRQSGRLITQNIRNCEIEKQAIVAAVNEFEKIILPDYIDAYGDGTAASKIVKKLTTAFK